METIASCQSKTTMELEFRWKIDNYPTVVLNSDLVQSPVFECFGRLWILELKHVFRKHNDEIYFTLILVDKSGNRLQKIPEDQYFDAHQMCALVSFLDPDGKVHGETHDLSTDGPLRSILKKGSSFGRIPIKLRHLKQYNIIHGNHGTIYILFELNIVVNALGNVSVTKDAKCEAAMPQNYAGKLFDNKKFTDFSIITSDQRKIPVHRAILNTSSLYFEGMLNSSLLEVRQGKIKVPESFKVMNEIIRFLYTGEFPKLEEIDLEVVVEMFVAADKYFITELKEEIETAVDAKLSVENACSVLVKAHAKGFETAKAKVAKFIGAHRSEIVGKDAWNELHNEYPDLLDYLFLHC